MILFEELKSVYLLSLLSVYLQIQNLRNNYSDNLGIRTSSRRWSNWGQSLQRPLQDNPSNSQFFRPLVNLLFTKFRVSLNSFIVPFNFCIFLFSINSANCLCFLFESVWIGFECFNFEKLVPWILLLVWRTLKIDSKFSVFSENWFNIEFILCLVSLLLW